MRIVTDDHPAGALPANAAPDTGCKPTGNADVRRPRLMLVTLLLGQFMGLLDLYIVNVALPTIGAELRASGTALQLVVGAYTVAYAMLLIVGARLGDLYGRRRVYLLGAAGFALASLACGLAPGIGALVVFRFVQGAAAAVMVPQIISVIQLSFTGRARAAALSAYTLVLSVGSIAGLVLGGVLIGAHLLDAAWRPVFLINVPLGAILVAAVPLAVPADRPVRSRRLDLVGLSLAVPAVLALVGPLVSGRELNWPAWTFASLAACPPLVALFVAVQRRVAARGGDPLLDLAVLRAPGMVSALATALTAMVGYGGFLFVFALHLQGGLGEAALPASLAFVPFGAAFGACSFCWRFAPQRWHGSLPAVGLALCAVSLAGVAVTTNRGPGWSAVLWSALVLYGAGLGLSTSLVTHALVRVPRQLVPDASGVLTTTMQLGQLIGVAACGTLYLTLTGGAGTGGGARAVGPGAGTVPGALARSVASAHAVATTTAWAAVLAVAGSAAALPLARTVAAARLAGDTSMLPAGSGRPSVLPHHVALRRRK